nr:hypothetical protein [Tanacetum cinerariifolium]
MLKTPFEKIFTSKLIKSLQLDGTYPRKDFEAYTEMQPQDFKERILANFDFIQKASDASSGDKDSSGIVSDKWNDQNLENQSNTSGDESSMLRNEDNDKSTFGDDTDIIPSYDTELMAEVPYTAEYNVFVVDSQHSEQPESINDTHVMEKNDTCDDERVALANLIANLKLDIDENQNIQKQLKKANATLTQELKKCKSTLEETNRTPREANSTQDNCLIALQNKKIELEKYKTYLNRTNEHDTLVHLHYVQSFEKEINELESQKADFSNIYDMLLQESGLTWKPMCKIFTYVGLKWIPIRKSVETCYNTNDSASPLEKKTHNPNTVICANSSSLSACTSMASEAISSKGSSNVVRLGISHMIQPEPEGSTQGRPIVRKAVLRELEAGEDDSSDESSNEEPSKPEPVQKVSRSIRDVYPMKPECNRNPLF